MRLKNYETTLRNSNYAYITVPQLCHRSVVARDYFFKYKLCVQVGAAEKKNCVDTFARKIL